MFSFQSWVDETLGAVKRLSYYVIRFLRITAGTMKLRECWRLKWWVNCIYFRGRVLDCHSRLKRLEALFYGSSALRCSYSWKRSHDAILKGDDDASDVEECTTECEAEFMRDGYEKLCEELRARAKEVGVNEIEVVASDYVGRANLTLEIIKLTRGGNERVVCVYNCRGLDYYFFPNLWEMVQFFDEGKEEPCGRSLVNGHESMG